MIADARRGRDTLHLGVVAFRFTALAWMTVSAVIAPPFRRPGLVVASIAIVAVWSVAATVLLGRAHAPAGPDPIDPKLAVYAADLAIAIGLVLVSALVVPRGSIGSRSFFATAYPAAAVLTWAVHGLRAGLIAAVAVAAALLASRPLGGSPLGDLTGTQAQSLANGVIQYLLAGGAVGLVSHLLQRAWDDLARVQDERMREAARAARLAEREALGRQIHDSVLQSLAMVHKRGRELAASAASGGSSEAGPGVGAEVGAEVARLADLAGAQEAELRALIMRTDVDAPAGSADLRDALETLARSFAGSMPVLVSAPGAVFVARHAADELAAAVRQAIDNTIEHAQASRVTVFVDERDDEIAISVRDDGRGFDAAAAGGYGLRSMRGRVTDLGGSLAILSRPGHGSEIEMRIPRSGA